MKMFKLPVVLFVLLITAMPVLGCDNKNDSPVSQISKVSRGDINVSILASGSLVTSKEYNLTFYSAGTVKSVMVKVGDMVNAGDVLAQLDTVELENSVAQAEISVKQARLNLENALKPPPDPLNVEIKELALTNAKKNLLEAEKKLQQATITAPIDGLVTDVNAVEGDQVSASAIIVRLIDAKNFQTTVYVNETEIYNVKIGMPATVKLVALPNRTYTARVSSVSETATISSNVVNYKVTVKLDPVDPETGNQISSQMSTGSSALLHNQPKLEEQTDKQGQLQMRQAASSPQPATVKTEPSTMMNGRLKEGLTVTVSIIVDERKDILLVPNQAITSRGNRYYVRVVDSEGGVEDRAIQVGITDGIHTEVISGLNENEQVSISAALNAASTASSGSTQRNAAQQMQRVLTPGSSMGGLPLR